MERQIAREYEVNRHSDEIPNVGLQWEFHNPRQAQISPVWETR